MLKALITTALLASSSVALADTPYDYNRPDRTEMDGRRDFDRRLDRRTNRPVVLASNVVLTNRSIQPTWIPIDGRYGINRLHLQLRSGSAYIDNVTVVFVDGSRENLPVREAISRRDRRISLPLPQHHAVRGIFIDSSSMRSARGAGRARMNRAVINVLGVRR